MLKNITLSADEELIAGARERAERQGTTLNAEFRSWLQHFVAQEEAARDYQELMRILSYGRPGGAFTREDLNAR
jgi:hypothetical protein